MTHVWMVPFVGLFFAAAVFLLLSPVPLRQLSGLLILANAISVLILVLGRLSAVTPPLVPAGLTAPDGPVANPVSQAFILFWLVAGVSFFGGLASMLLRVAANAGGQGDDRGDAARGQESGTSGQPEPPLNY